MTRQKIVFVLKGKPKSKCLNSQALSSTYYALQVVHFVLGVSRNYCKIKSALDVMNDTFWMFVDINLLSK